MFKLSKILTQYHSFIGFLHFPPPLRENISYENKKKRIFLMRVFVSEFFSPNIHVSEIFFSNTDHETKYSFTKPVDKLSHCFMFCVQDHN